MAGGELVAVLPARAYARLAGASASAFYTDARDTAAKLRDFVYSGRPGDPSGLLRRLAAPFTDQELLALDVRWVYRSSSSALRLVDVAARHMSRAEPVPSDAVLDLPRKLTELTLALTAPPMPVPL
jgi:hypothetical protein